MAASSQQTTLSSLPEVTKITGMNKITHFHKRSQDKIFITTIHNLINSSINSRVSSSAGTDQRLLTPTASIHGSSTAMPSCLLFARSRNAKLFSQRAMIT